MIKRNCFDFVSATSSNHRAPFAKAGRLFNAPQRHARFCYTTSYLQKRHTQLNAQCICLVLLSEEKTCDTWLQFLRKTSKKKTWKTCLPDRLEAKKSGQRSCMDYACLLSRFNQFPCWLVKHSSIVNHQLVCQDCRAALAIRERYWEDPLMAIQQAFLHALIDFKWSFPKWGVTPVYRNHQMCYV